MNLYLESCYFGGIMAASSVQPHKMSSFSQELRGIILNNSFYIVLEMKIQVHGVFVKGQTTQLDHPVIYIQPDEIHF